MNIISTLIGLQLIIIIISSSVCLESWFFNCGIWHKDKPYFGNFFMSKIFKYCFYNSAMLQGETNLKQSRLPEFQKRNVSLAMDLLFVYN